MIKRFLKSNLGFFILCLIIWVLFILLIHGGYAYTGRPIRSTMKNTSVRREFNKTGAMLNVTKELYLSLMNKEERSSERAHIYTNIGAIYFDMYKATALQRVFDSTEHYFRKSIEALPDNRRFKGNLIRLYETKRAFDSVPDRNNFKE